MPHDGHPEVRGARMSSAAARVMFGLFGGGAFALVALTRCGEEAEPETVHEKVTHTANFSRGDSGPEAPEVTFSDVLGESGINFRHVSGAFGNKYIPETMGSGVALFDYDGDTLTDILFVQSHWFEGHEGEGAEPTLALYRNLGGWRFEDVTEAAGLALTVYGMGATVADFDGDADPDVYLTCVGPNRLLVNEGGRFVDGTEAAGLAGATWEDDAGNSYSSWSTSAAWFDQDLDGDLDLFVCNYIRWSKETDLPTTLTGTVKAYTRPDEYPSETCRLYRNQGDGTFVDVSEETGILLNTAKSLGVALADVNGDGFEDIVVANDTKPNFLFLSKGDGTYEEGGNDASIAYDADGRARAGMGVDVADFQDDGHPAIAIGNFHGEPVSLFVKEDTALFLDRARSSRLHRETLPTLTFGLRFFDYDLDGRLDLLACNGHIEPDINQVERNIQYEQPMQLFWNQGDGKFQAIKDAAGPAMAQPIVGRGLAVADLDADGDLDCVVNCNNGAPRLLRNDQSLNHHWLRVDLQGLQSTNGCALGAEVVVQAGGRTQTRRCRTGSSYLSQSEMTLTFGLGEATKVDGVTVRWPGGASESFTLDAVDCHWKLAQGGGATKVSSP